ncbi:hypothetical protein [Luteolibacter sp. LG18]|uniref:hypothetical protein n=1 Tax=Luteolibacter sp. LG18 TaxID=2819286 RepID=UPI002B2A638E|nr:hypothetical protein llg_07320 [Luteolibacter sp. LG18]BCU79639.1 hypothetical protein llg_43540 [Luteolibacter sp. LG18]
MSRKVLWFDRGRDAFTEGKPCHFDDARVSGHDRQEWYRGWRHQQHLNAKPRPDHEREDTRAALREIRESLDR